MGYTVKTFQTTPNPNAVKCILDRKAGDRPRSYFKAEDAAGDELAMGLFGVAGVTNVLINGEWIAVNKRPDADWKAVKAGVERVLRDAR